MRSWEAQDLGGSISKSLPAVSLPGRSVQSQQGRTWNSYGPHNANTNASVRLEHSGDKHCSHLCFIYNQEKCAIVQREWILEPTIYSITDVPECGFCSTSDSCGNPPPPQDDGAMGWGNLPIIGSHGFVNELFSSQRGLMEPLAASTR